jgi:hypothetical protein
MLHNRQLHTRDPRIWCKRSMLGLEPTESAGGCLNFQQRARVAQGPLHQSLDIVTTQLQLTVSLLLGPHGDMAVHSYQYCRPALLTCLGTDAPLSSRKEATEQC